MKRLILLLVCILTFAVSASARSYMTFKATSYAYASINQYSGRYTWSDWNRCSVKIIFDLREDVIYINSNSPQKYVVVSSGSSSTDSSGGSQVSYKVIDQDGDRGTLRLRIESNGNSQLYVDFADVAWCYNVVRTN